MVRALLNRKDQEQNSVYWWRVEELERAGYDPDAAEVLAICVDVNLHEAVDLIQDGCDQRTCLQILL